MPRMFYKHPEFEKKLKGLEGIERHKSYMRLLRKNPQQKKKELEQVRKFQKTTRYKQWRKKYYSMSRTKEMIRVKNRNNTRKKRLLALKRLGNKCARCGFSDWRALQIDHINGGGMKENRRYGGNWIDRNVLKLHANKLKSKYQLLCANCNWIKKYENGENGIRKY